MINGYKKIENGDYAFWILSVIMNIDIIKE